MYTDTDASIGQVHAERGLFFGIVGFIFFPLLFGVLALSENRKAEKLGVHNQTVNILGYANIVVGIVLIVYFGTTITG